VSIFVTVGIAVTTGDRETLDTGTEMLLSDVPVVSVDDWLDTLVTITELVEVSTNGEIVAGFKDAVTIRGFICSFGGSPLTETTDSFIFGISVDLTLLA
jgi:hypothetical protein